MSNAHKRPWHRDSVFGVGIRVPMCRERRAVWRARLVMFRRARKITPLHEDIGLAMLRRLGSDGRLDPSHQTLADDVGCDQRSVQRALAAFRTYGLVLWVRRLVRDGWRTAQSSNSYALAVGTLPAVPVPACDRQTGGQTLKTEIPPMPPASPGAIAAAQRALAERRHAIEAGLLRNGVT